MRRLLLLLPALALAWPLSTTDWDMPPDPQGLAARLAWRDSPHPPREGRPPNLVIILADDLSRQDLSLYGGTRLRTQNIDRIAAEGVRFDEGTITSPICAPSRAGILTGRYPQRYGFELITHSRYPRSSLERFGARFFATGDGWTLYPAREVPNPEQVLLQGLPEGEYTLAEVLKRRGYATGLFGKWHLGASEGQVPTARGFDEQVGFYEAFTLYADPQSPEVVNHTLDIYADKHQWEEGRHGNCAMRRQGDPFDDDMYLTDRLTLEARAFIRAHKDEPFFLYLPYLAPHTPLQAPRKYWELHAEEPDPGRRVYTAMLHSLDDAVGEILAELDAQGLREDTLIVFLSDNGGAIYTQAADIAPLKGGKFTHFEGGVNVPFLMRWPGQVPEGLVVDHPVSSLDIFATFVEAAQAELPPGLSLDGVSLLRTVAEDRPPHPRLFWRALSYKAVREGDWKLLIDEQTGSQALYNLREDKAERHNLAQQEPARVQALGQALAEWEAGLAPPRWPPVMQYSFHDESGEWRFPL